MNTEAIALIIAFASVAAVAALAIYVIRSRSTVRDANNDDIVSRLDDFTTKFATGQGVFSEKFKQLDTKLASVQTAVDNREGAIQEQMGRIGTQVTGIVSLFNNDRTRGSWRALS